jgi:hypothetical protein
MCGLGTLYVGYGRCMRLTLSKVAVASLGGRSSPRCLLDDETVQSRDHRSVDPEDNGVDDDIYRCRLVAVADLVATETMTAHTNAEDDGDVQNRWKLTVGD